MTINYLIKTALVGLRTNKSRAILTILGITIGITAIITVMSLGQGAQDLIIGQVQSIGAKVVAIAPGRQPTGPSDFASSFTDSLKASDLDALQRKENVPHLARIMPVLFGSDSVVYENNVYRPSVFGVSSMYADIYDAYPKEGRIFSDEEVKSYADVVIIGSKLKEKLFGESDALGAKIKIRGKNFKVIGLLPTKGSATFFNFDDAAVIPYTTAQQYIFGIKYFHRLVVEADKEINVDQTVADIKTTLRASHGITDPTKDDFFVETQADALKTVSTITNVLTLFLAAIAAISLLVGGVGIMNIMLVSVTERTREIGLRKAIGATDANILVQFLLESVILTCLGGVLGITFGAAISLLASVVLTQVLNQTWGFTVPLTAVLLGLGVSAFIGLVFGLYPARQASKKSPIEALRYE